MDSLTFLGVIIACIALGFGQVLEGGSLGALLNFPALLIVLGGTVGAVMLQTPFLVFRNAFRLFPQVLFPKTANSEELIDKVTQWSHQARQMGLLSLEKQLNSMEQGVNKQALEMVLAGIDKETIRKVLEIEIDKQEVFALQSARVFESMGGYCPTIGIMGAVIGLIQVMRNLSDPSELGLGIAVAFVATIYGVGFANLFFLPVANKLKYHIYQQIRLDEMFIEGVLAMAEGDNPKMIEMKMNSYC